jgi:hypothetical protein
MAKCINCHNLEMWTSSLEVCFIFIFLYRILRFSSRTPLSSIQWKSSEKGRSPQLGNFTC